MVWGVYHWAAACKSEKKKPTAKWASQQQKHAWFLNLDGLLSQEAKYAKNNSKE